MADTASERPRQVYPPLAEGTVSQINATPAPTALRARLDRVPNILPIPDTTWLDHLAENARVLAPEAA